MQERPTRPPAVPQKPTADRLLHRREAVETTSLRIGGRRCKVQESSYVVFHVSKKGECVLTVKLETGTEMAGGTLVRHARNPAVPYRFDALVGCYGFLVESATNQQRWWTDSVSGVGRQSRACCQRFRKDRVE